MPKRERKISFKLAIERRESRRWLTPVACSELKAKFEFEAIAGPAKSISVRSRMTFEDVIYEVRNGVGWIIIDRPDQMNAFRCTPPVATSGSAAAAKT
jgi:hypothetical protein